MPLKTQTIDHLLPEITRRLRDTFDPCTIYLFGSHAEQRASSGSDIDLLVIIPQSDLSFYQRATQAYRALRHLGTPIDVQVYTREEFEQRADLPVSFERTVRDKGRIIHAA